MDNIRILSCIFFLISWFPSNGQAQVAATKAIKLNLNSAISPKNNKAFYMRPSVSMLFKAHKRLFHEIEINRLASSNEIDTVTFPYVIRFKNTTLNFGYQMTLTLCPRKRITPQLGISLRHDIQKSKIDPIDSKFDKRRVAMIRTTIGIVPKLQANLNKRLFAGVAMPFDFVDIIFYTQKVEDMREGGALQESYILRSLNFSLSLGIRLL